MLQAVCAGGSWHAQYKTPCFNRLPIAGIVKTEKLQERAIIGLACRTFGLLTVTGYMRAAEANQIQQRCADKRLSLPAVHNGLYIGPLPQESCQNGGINQFSTSGVDKHRTLWQARQHAFVKHVECGIWPLVR